MEGGLLFRFFFFVFLALSFVSAQDIGYASSCEGNYCALVTDYSTIEYAGHFFSISSIDGEIILNIDDFSSKITAEKMTIGDLKIYNISRGLLQNGQEILSFYFTSEEDVVLGPPILKSSCSDNECTLYEGETIDFLGYSFQVQFIGSIESSEYIPVLVIDSVVTPALVEGSILKIDDKNYIYIKEILTTREFIEEEGQVGTTRKIYFKILTEEDEVIPGPLMLNDTEQSCVGCLLNDICYPLGYRKSGQYCSDDFEFVAQNREGMQCENNFECGSNVCVSGECVSASLIQKILNWFRKLFGRE